MAEKQNAQSREQRKKDKQNEKKLAKQQELEKIKRPRMRVIPIWIRIILVAAFFCVAVVAGAMFGYGILGDGAPMDVLKKETWEHILDLVKVE
ncbi:hypothetical protein BC6307_21480 [Sutcliffiella cohnii]|uniref:DNA-directed RNA polymerase subunit beta n=1 Tax=Sutcliffiella cohnii TaxID=33932 RepID=A0A223KWA8_9BACI|nr:DNA-directed RNA polymerase subunit beta [Sutcliffiella cohnii]AST93653.1 hypothetical protein BC6307_21480 [Sutcliffiella cohnii]